MKEFLTKIKEAYNYFLFYPDKTLVIVQVYFLNPIYNFTEKIIEILFSLTRKCILLIVKK